MVNELIQELAQRGIKLALSEGRLAVSAPRGSLTDSLRERVKTLRNALISELAKVGTSVAASTLEPIVPQPDRAHLPFALSDLQLGFYMANDPYMEYHVRPHCYMEQDRAPLDIARYEAAWNKALSRHELAFCFINTDVQLQKLPRTPRITIAVNDFRGVDASERELRLAAIRTRNERRELPLDAWPWFDLSSSVWLQDGVERYRIHYNHNSFFIDGYATTQLFAEVERYYADPQLTLPPRTLSYRDAVLGLRALELTPQGQESKEYWLSRLVGLPSPPDLPQVPALERRCRSMLNRREALLSRTQWDAFKANASANRITPSNAVLAVYSHVIAVWSHSDRFILSQMVTRRLPELHPEIKSLIGNFASLYPLEISIDRAQPFVVNAARIQAQVMRDIEHLHYGGMQVLQELNKLQGSFGSAPSPFVVGSGLFMKDYRKWDFVLLETSQTVLDHQFFELPDGSYHYVWDLMEEFFPPGLIDSMWRAFGRLLLRLCEDAGAWSRKVVGLLDDPELHPRHLRNQTEEVFPATLLHDALPLQARSNPTQSALRQANRALSYSELEEWSKGIASRLNRSGLRAGQKVAVVMPRCTEAVVAVMGVLKAGGAYVPVDPNLPPRRRDLLMRDVAAPVALTLPHLQERLEWPEGISVIGVDALYETDSNAMEPVDFDSLAYVIYTSGTTGTPKGVMISHRAAMNTVHDVNSRFGVSAADVFLGVSPLNFDLSVYDIFGAIAAGATLVYPEVEAALDPAHWLALIESERVTVWNSVPALMSLLIECAVLQRRSLPSLRLVLLSGDKIPTNLPERIHQIAPNARVIALGGATEAAIWSIQYPLERGRSYDTLVPYGFPMANQRWHIRDRYGEDVPTWVPGELVIAGAGLARGYYGDEEKTARSFITDGISGERLYRTGDVGRYRPDGCIEIHGRIDHQVKVQGHRIELGEIEATLLRYPGVRQAVAGVRKQRAQRGEQLVAYVCVDPATGASTQQLEHHLRLELPAYMIPQQWVLLDELPRTTNGKVDREALGRLDPSVSEHSETVARAYAPPRTPHESALVSMWQDVLQIERIGIEDDFFQLGGQSFDAIRIFTRIKNAYGHSFTLGDIWQARTVAALARQLDQQSAVVEIDPLVAICDNKAGMPLALVHPAGGSIMGYVHLAQRVQRPVYAFQALWHEEGATAPRGVSELAGEYVARLVWKQPDGPYTLGGWSSGGVVAFEMARQIEQAGGRVEHLYLLDAPAPRAHADLRTSTLMTWFMEDLALGLPVEHLAEEDLDALTPEQALARAISLLQPYSSRELTHTQLLPIYRVFVDMLRVVAAYVPSDVGCNVTIVRARENGVSEFADHPGRATPEWGWRAFIHGRIRSITAPGDHHSFLMPGQLESWIATLQD